MKKRIFVGLILVLLLLPMSALHVLADAHYNMYDITQETSGIAPEGFTYPALFFDYEKGITEEEIKQISEVYLTAVRVFSQYAEEGVKNIENDTLIYPKYIKYGIPNNAPYQDPNYLNEQVYRGLTLKRGEENEFKPFTGEFYFSDDDRYKADEGVSYHNYYSYCADVNFSISNVVFKDDGIYMDIDGEQSYYYAVTTRLEFYHDWEKEKPAFDSYKAKIEKSATAEETKRIISGKGVKLDYVLYDIEGTDDKNLFLKYENGGIKILFLVRGVIGNKSAGTPSAEVTQNAEENPGEDGGVGISTDIVDPDDDKGHSKSDKVKSTSSNESDSDVGGAIAVGVLSTGTAIGAAAAASGKGKSKGNSKKKSYKMYVQKDFGDAIRRGADPVKIRARMAEVGEDGVSRDRNDLTALISVSGDGMTIHDAALVGRYCEATVSVPSDNYNDTANIIFTFNGEGGTFTNTVIFRLVDGPSLKFVEETETPGTFNLYTAVKYVDMIPGDGFTYVEQFMIVDATVPPEIEDMTADKVEGYDVRFEKTDRQYVYKVIIKNNTPPLAEEQKDLFAVPKQENLTFHVKVQGEKEPVDGYVTMFMYQEGITVASDQKEKKKGQTYVRVQAYEKENVGALDKKWQVSQMKFTLAVKGKDKSIINPTEAKYKFEKLKGAGGIGTTADKEDALAEKYKFIGTPCEINEKPGYQFEPQANLSEPTDGTFFMVLLPTFVTYEHKEYQAEIPLRLRGKDMDPMADWEKEFEDLKRRIEKYSLPGNKDAWLARMESCALEPRVSVEELRLVSKWIIREYMTYWTSQGEKALSEARMYNVIVNTLEWTKFAGDCAFSFLVAAYAGPVAEALISPAKDFITGAIGEVIAAKANGEAVDVDNFEFSKNLAAAGDNLVSNNISLTDWRKAAATLAGYFCYAAIKNYLTKLNEKGESDFYGALCEGFKDMTLAALKSKAGDLIGKWLKDSKKFQETIGPKIASYFKETNMDTLQKKLNDALGLEGELRKLAGYANDKVVEATVKDVVEKYIGNLVGAGFDKLRETYDKSKFGMEGTHMTYCFNIELFDAFSFGVKLDLTQILLNTNGMFFGWFYDLFFAGVPAASSVINMPKDPELPPIQA